MSKQTPLYADHQNRGASFTDFGGYQMPLKYDSELGEHRAVRETAGIFDLGHMGEVRITGDDAPAFLDYAFASKMSAMSVSRAKYSFVLTADGGIIDDLITYRLGETEYLTVPNAANIGPIVDALNDRTEGFDVQVTDESDQTSLIAVQGPVAEQILLRLAADSATVEELKYFRGVRTTVAGHDALLARTGYTGEDGFEIIVANADAPDLWQRTLDSGEDLGAVPAGLASRDSLRLEAGMPLYGHELTTDLTPFDAGMGKVVSFKKTGDFVGRGPLESVKDETPDKVLVGLKSSGRRAARAGYAVNDSVGDPIGEITSGAPSPTLGYPIAMAYIDSAHSEPGTEVAVDLRGKPTPFEVVVMPFFSKKKS